MELVTIDDIRTAADRITPVTLTTPLVPWEGCLLKAENLQQVGSFKIRGAYNAVVSLRPPGVVTYSSGNHGQALAYAAREYGVPCVVFAAEGMPEVKAEGIRRWGAELVLVPPAERIPRGEALAVERGLTLIPPYDHLAVIAGQGTIGLEIMDAVPDVEVVLVPIGGGGLASGVSSAIKALDPRVTVIGVEPELAADAAESLASGHLVSWSPELTFRSVADGLRGGLSELTFAHLRDRLDGIVTVGEEEIRAAMGRMARSARLVAEPSGAVAAAAFLSGRTPAGTTVAVVSGGNADPALLREVI
ncbi:threonine/serine dehydratase [Streptosporangium sp. KLBMP 9127]|nr:threonine/serine dehydratase [Streptosporangium sp. KLBMP 9127]